MYTNHCVLSTCIGAADEGYRVIVPEDAVGSWSADLHNKAAAFPLCSPPCDGLWASARSLYDGEKV